MSVFFSVVTLSAQIKAPTPGDVETFMKSKTYVVLEENPFSPFNLFAAEGLQNYYKIRPFEIINSDDFQKKMTDTKSSFLFVSQARYGDNKQQYDYNILNLVMGHSSGNLNKMPNLCIVPISYADVDEEVYEYRFPALIRFVDYYMRYISKNPGKDIEEIVKENTQEIKKLELWLVKSDLAPDVNTEEKIKKIYPYKVKIVEPEEIEAAIHQANPNVALLHKVGPEGTQTSSATCWKFIVTAAEGKPLYYANHKITSASPDAFLPEDFKNLAK